MCLPIALRAAARLWPAALYDFLQAEKAVVNITPCVNLTKLLDSKTSPRYRPAER